MNKILLDNIRSNYNALENFNNEADLCHRVIDDFLIYLGYNKNWCTFEERTPRKKFTDIFIRCPDNSKLIVEVKRKNHILDNDDKMQLSSYLNDHKVEWGILTNGNQFLLMNNLIPDINLTDSCCIKFELIENHRVNSNLNNILLNFFSYEYLFKKKTSQYFAEFQNFKLKSLSNSKKISIHQYQSANFNFFNYVAHRYSRPVDLDDLSLNNLIDYFTELLNNKKLKPSSIKNKYRYIKGFVDFLEKNNKLPNKNPFSRMTENGLMHELNLTVEDTLIEPISKKEILLLLDYQTNDTRNGLRNVLITKLVCYLALDINTLSNIKVDDLKFNEKSCSIFINNRTFPIPESMISDFQKYKNQREIDNVKIPYLFYTTYKEDNGKHRQIKTGTIHEIINLSFNKIESIEKSRRKLLTYSLLKASAIKYLYDNKFSLEEISAFTGLNIDSILKYLDSKEIYKRCANLNNHLLNNHPLSKIF